MVSKDQITVKVHRFAKKDVARLNKKLKKYYKFNNETGLFDIAVYRVMIEAKDVDWLSEKQRDDFFELILNDLNDLRMNKKIKVEMRGLGKIT